MREHIIEVADGFWNIRGSFKVAGLIDIGTHASLVRRSDGRFLLLDSYTLKDGVAREVDELTGGKENVVAVLNLHPFHTIHVRAIHERYPDAKHYGTARHLSRHPELTWQPERTEDAALHDLVRRRLRILGARRRRLHLRQRACPLFVCPGNAPLDEDDSCGRHHHVHTAAARC